jgi:ABC-type Na+ transport system ATPase subunit NatA
MDPREAVRIGAVASAPCDVALPARWTVRDLVWESARLANHPRSELKAQTDGALHALGLDAAARMRLGFAELAVRRAAVLAAALATGAETILAFDFTTGLPDVAARSLARTFVTACKGRRLLLFTGHLALASPLGLHIDEAVVFTSGRFVYSGSPADVATRERTYAIRTTGNAAELATRLRERGVIVSGHVGASELTVTLPEDLSTLELVATAQAQNMAILELVPVSDVLV